MSITQAERVVDYLLRLPLALTTNNALDIAKCAIEQMTLPRYHTWEDYDLTDEKETTKTCKEICEAWKYEFDASWTNHFTQNHVCNETKRLGRGAYGSVYECQDPNTVCKIFVKSDETDYAAFFREATILQRLESVGSCAYPRLVGLDFPRIFLQPRGRTLYDVLYKSKQSYSEYQAYEWMQQILSGLASAHKVHVFHRDVKPDNVILDDSGNAILIDWASGQLDIDVKYLHRIPRIAACENYRAPECNSKVIALTEDVLAANDVWSVGCVFYELLHGKRLFSGEVTKPVDVAKLQTRMTSDLESHILRQMLEWDPLKRIKAEQAAAWFLERLAE